MEFAWCILPFKHLSTLRCHQTWLAGKWTIKIDFSQPETSIYMGFSSRSCLMTPEGKSMTNPMKNHHFPMSFVWFSYVFVALFREKSATPGTPRRRPPLGERDIFIVILIIFDAETKVSAILREAWMVVRAGRT